MFGFQRIGWYSRATMLMVLVAGSGWIQTAAVKGQVSPAEKSEVAAASAPRELAMQPLPVYRINPPDILAIEMLKMVPPSPYHIAVYDVLQIRTAHALPEQPINENYLVEASGEVDLGPAYGKIKLVGLTTDESAEAIAKKLAQVLKQPDVSVQLARTAGTQPVTGEYLVATDGRINLRAYGTILVKGMTIAEARQAIEQQLTKFFVSPEISVDVKGYNSQVYYVILDGAGMGDNVRRMPITGNDTVLDAIGAIGGLSQMSSKKIWVARPSPANAEKGQVLAVDYEAITQRGATASNYQIMPGDRIFIAPDNLVAMNNNLSKKTAPIERALGVTALTASTFQGLGSGANRAPATPGAAKQPSKKPSPQEIEANLTDALYRCLQQIIPLIENP